MKYVADYIKILIGLSSALLVVSVTFLDKIAGANTLNIFLAAVCWIAAIGSIWFGSQAILHLAYIDEDDDGTHSGEDLENTLFDTEFKRNIGNQRILTLAAFVILASMALISAATSAQS